MRQGIATFLEPWVINDTCNDLNTVNKIQIDK